jgi:polysaccharide pyruvyl transferase WcaK-like protein
MERKVRIGISGSYGGMNLGDEAILEGILVELRASADVEATVFSRNPADTLAQYYGLLANAADFVVERFDAEVVFVPMEKFDVPHSHGARQTNEALLRLLRRK